MEIEETEYEKYRGLTIEKGITPIGKKRFFGIIETMGYNTQQKEIEELKEELESVNGLFNHSAKRHFEEKLKTAALQKRVTELEEENNRLDNLIANS